MYILLTYDAIIGPIVVCVISLQHKIKMLKIVNICQWLLIVIWLD